MAYKNSSRARPKELEVAGKGKFCFIPLCKSSTYDCDGQLTNIGFFKFPDKHRHPEKHKKWIST